MGIGVWSANGTANILMVFVLVSGRLAPRVQATDRHTAVDSVHLLKQVSDTWFPNAPKIALVQAQSQHPQTRRTVRGVSAAEEARRRLAVRVALLAQDGSWLEYGRAPKSVCCQVSASTGAFPF